MQGVISLRGLATSLEEEEWKPAAKKRGGLRASIQGRITTRNVNCHDPKKHASPAEGRSYDLEVPLKEGKDDVDAGGRMENSKTTQSPPPQKPPPTNRRQSHFGGDYLSQIKEYS